MAATPIVPEEARLVVTEIEPERSEMEQQLAALRGLDGTELAQAGRLGQRRIEQVKALDTKAAMWVIAVKAKLAPGKQAAYTAWKSWTKLEDELVAPAEAIRNRARPLIGQYQLELGRQADAEAQRLREEQRRAAEEQRQAQEAEAERLRREAEKLAAQGEDAAAEEKQIEATFVESQPIVPTAVTAQQVAPPKIDAGRVVFWRKLINPQLFLNWVIKQSIQLVPRADDSNESVITGYGWSLTLKFDTSFKSKGLDADIPGIVVTKSYESRTARSRR